MPTSMMATLRPKWSAIQPAIGPPNMAPTGTMACIEREGERGRGGREGEARAMMKSNLQ